MRAADFGSPVKNAAFREFRDAGELPSFARFCSQVVGTGHFFYKLPGSTSIVRGCRLSNLPFRIARLLGRAPSCCSIGTDAEKPARSNIHSSTFNHQLHYHSAPTNKHLTLSDPQLRTWFDPLSPTFSPPAHTLLPRHPSQNASASFLFTAGSVLPLMPLNFRSHPVFRIAFFHRPRPKETGSPTRILTFAVLYLRMKVTVHAVHFSPKPSLEVAVFVDWKPVSFSPPPIPSPHFANRVRLTFGPSVSCRSSSDVRAYRRKRNGSSRSETD